MSLPRILMRIRAKLGDAHAQHELAGLYFMEGIRWCRKSAEQGHAEAQNDLGFCYANGMGVTKNLAEASNWFRKAADQGHTQAYHNLAACVHNLPEWLNEMKAKKE